MIISFTRLIAEERYHEDRISHIERLFSALSLSIGGVARKTALMRDKGDKLSRTLQVCLLMVVQSHITNTVYSKTCL